MLSVYTLGTSLSCLVAHIKGVRKVGYNMKESRMTVNGKTYRCVHKREAQYEHDSLFTGVSIYGIYAKPCLTNVESFMNLERCYQRMNENGCAVIEHKGAVCGGSWSYTYKARGKLSTGEKVIFIETRDNSWLYIYDL